MTVTPARPSPTNRPISRRTLGLIVAGAATAVGLAGHAWLNDAPIPPTSPRSSIQPLAVADSDLFAEGDFLWWHENLVATAAMFECRPAAAGDAAASVVVWTDKANHIVAFAASREGAQLPGYAMTMATQRGIEANQSVQRAGKGHAVLAAGKKSTLQLQHMKLDCERTSDD